MVETGGGNIVNIASTYSVVAPNHKIYDEAAKIYKKKIKTHDCLLSAIENRENYFFNKKTINFRRTPWPRSQDLKPLISLPFVINILKRITR